MLMAYTVDLISVLKSLFCITLQPAGKTDWEVLKEAFKDYEHLDKRKIVHASCRLMYDEKNLTLTKEGFRLKISQLLDISLGLDIHESRAK